MSAWFLCLLGGVLGQGGFCLPAPRGFGASPLKAKLLQGKGWGRRVFPASGKAGEGISSCPHPSEAVWTKA